MVRPRRGSEAEGTGSHLADTDMKLPRSTPWHKARRLECSGPYAFYEVQGVASSNPAVPTNKIKRLQYNGCKPLSFVGVFAPLFPPPLANSDPIAARDMILNKTHAIQATYSPPMPTRPCF